MITHVTNCLSGVYYIYVCFTAAPGTFKAPGQPGACPVRPNIGIWLRALNKNGRSKVATMNVQYFTLFAFRAMLTCLNSIAPLITHILLTLGTT